MNPSPPTPRKPSERRSRSRRVFLCTHAANAATHPRVTHTGTLSRVSLLSLPLRRASARVLSRILLDPLSYSVTYRFPRISLSASLFRSVLYLARSISSRSLVHSRCPAVGHTHSSLLSYPGRLSLSAQPLSPFTLSLTRSSLSVHLARPLPPPRPRRPARSPPPSSCCSRSPNLRIDRTARSLAVYLLLVFPRGAALRFSGHPREQLSNGGAPDRRRARATFVGRRRPAVTGTHAFIPRTRYRIAPRPVPLLDYTYPGPRDANGARWPPSRRALARILRLRMDVNAVIVDRSAIEGGNC